LFAEKMMSTINLNRKAIYGHCCFAFGRSSLIRGYFNYRKGLVKCAYLQQFNQAAIVST